MNAIDTSHHEAVGPGFSLDAMSEARDRSMQAIESISGSIRPGMTQGEATDLATRTLQDMGMDHTWHRTLVRFGADTLKKFNEPVAQGNVLREDDIYFIDIGPVWAGHEGDAGDTFVVGRDPAMAACAEAARWLWCEVSERWRRQRPSGEVLYRFADERARALGWRLNLEVKGHRVGDFPHAIHQAGRLGDLDRSPLPGLWVLEIQIAHPYRPFGAFYEDLLVDVR